MSAQVISISHTSQLLLLLLFVMVGHSLVWLVCWRHAWPITMWWCCFWLFNAAAFCSSFNVIFIIKKSDENFYCAEERKKGIFQMHPLLKEQRREKGREREKGHWHYMNINFYMEGPFTPKTIIIKTTITDSNQQNNI